MSAWPEASPTTYTVKLDEEGNWLSQPIKILRDPQDLGTAQDIQANTHFPPSIPR